MQEQEDPPQAVVELVRVEKSYHLDSVPVIKGINLIVRPACFSVLLGPSGSGKTTLLNLMGCVDKPDQGEVVVANCQVGALDDDALSDFRGETIGFIFQNFNLLPVLSAYENIEYPLLLAGAPASRCAASHGTTPLRPRSLRPASQAAKGASSRSMSITPAKSSMAIAA